ncbi:MAG: N-6 DNA methylase, partial [Candidatus Acinetobacter avistercoris]|nr:N-6 DNA methylase [Candidatus Acinetobacter avistercoris]
MGGKLLNNELKNFVKKFYTNTKADLFAVMIERCIELGTQRAFLGMVTPYVWMFISSYEELRKKIVEQHTLESLIQLEYNAFEPACIPVATFILNNNFYDNYKGCYIKLSDFKGHQIQPLKT